MNDVLNGKASGLADFVAKQTSALTVSFVATLLSVSKREIYKLAAEHRIPNFKVGGSIRFDPLAFSAWLREKMAPASAPAPNSERQQA